MDGIGGILKDDGFHACIRVRVINRGHRPVEIGGIFFETLPTAHSGLRRRRSARRRVRGSPYYPEPFEILGAGPVLGDGQALELHFDRSVMDHETDSRIAIVVVEDTQANRYITEYPQPNAFSRHYDWNSPHLSVE
jgi:hypothetical protein